MSKQATPPPPGDKPKPTAPPPPPSWRHWLWPIAIAVIFVLFLFSPIRTTSTSLTYTKFLADASAHQVKTIDIASTAGGTSSGALTNGKSYTVVIPPQAQQSFLNQLATDGVQVTATPAGNGFGTEVLIYLIVFGLPIGISIWLFRRISKGAAGGLQGVMGVGRSRAKVFDEERPDTKFSDVAGYEGAKSEISEVVDFLRKPDRYTRAGAMVPRGVLMVGPPGTGKTLLARAVAGESGVPFFSISASEFIEMFVGLGAARVRDLFKEAKKSAPTIVFIDEIDAVGRSRGAGLGGGNDEREQTLNQLLSEMDGFDRTDLVVVIAATNRPDVLDPALLRPGRFDRRILVDRPELAARRAILGVHVKGKPLAPDVDLQILAQNTPGFSGADLANLVNEAALSATRKGRDSIAAEDFAEAFDKIVLGDPREAKLDPKEKRRVAVHESGHAVIARFSPEAEPLHRVTIIPRGMALGATQQSPGADRHLMAQAELESRLRVLMGGYASERLILGSISTGAENDLKEATHLASHMMAHYGMSERLGPVYYDHEAEHPFLGQRFGTESGTSSSTITVIEEEARRVLARALEEATAMLTQRRAELDRLVIALLEHETLERDDLTAILGPPLAPPASDDAPPAARWPPPVV